MAAERGKWIKACDTSACVEVFYGRDIVHISGTKELGDLSFTYEEWDIFLAGVKDGKFDL